MWLVLLLLSSTVHALPTVELVDAGAEPRAVLTRSWTEVPQIIEQVTRSHTVVELGGMPDPDPIDSTQTLRWSATAQGQDRVLVELADAASTTTATEGDHPDAGRFVGLSALLQLDALGRVLDAAVTPPAGAFSEAEQRQLDLVAGSVEQLTVILPTEPVGVGASWRIRDTIRAGTIPVEVGITSTLMEREGDTLRLSLDIGAEGRPTELEVDGFSGKVKGLRFEGEQALTVDLTRPLPTQRTGTSELYLQLSGWKGVLPIKLTLGVSQQVAASAR